VPPLRLLTSCVESSVREMAGRKPTAKLKSTAKGSNASHTQTDELSRYIKSLQARTRLDKILKKLKEGHPNSKARGNT
jgi:hypothetical protein